jgi:hypothetical protein
MTTVKTYIIFFAILIATGATAQTTYKTLVKDFQNISGNWTGSLTYLDYTSGESYSMPADVEIKRIKKKNLFTFSDIYPDEPHANSVDTLILSMDGKYINDELIVSRKKLANGDVIIVTTRTGTDGNDNKPASFRFTYTLGKASFIKRKDVQFEGESEYINRHEYAYIKKTKG